MSSHPLPKLHNAMWPGLVGKGDGEGQEPAISLDTMLEWTAAARVDGQREDPRHLGDDRAAEPSGRSFKR